MSALASSLVAWLIIQVAETIFPLFGFGDTPARIVSIVLAIGLVPSMIIFWVFELTPERFKKEKDIDRNRFDSPQSRQKLNRIIVVVLAFYALSGQLEAAITTLEEWVNRGGATSLLEQPIRHGLGVLADDPRYQSILRTVNNRLSEQKANLVRWEASGEMLPIPSVVTDPR